MTVKDLYKVAYSVYETDRYDDFIFLEENRDIAEAHVKRLAVNIREGYQMPPLIVDADMAVIDGQHRLKAYESLGLPVQFIIQRDMKENTLQRANTDVKTWTTPQHIAYHIKQDNEDYIKLKEYKEYTELPWANALRILGGSKDPKVKSQSKIIQYGLFEVRHESDAYEFADEVILRMRMEMPGNKIISAIKKLYDAGVDTRRLVTAINVCEEEIKLINVVPKIMETISKVYNRDLKKSEQIKFKKWTSGVLAPYI